MSYQKFITHIFVLLIFAVTLTAQSDLRPLKLDDLFKIKDVRDVQVSPDGRWVAYVVSTTDVKADKSDSDVWMVSLDGKTERRITFSTDNETSPRWSPDGKYLSFVSSRPGPNKGSQIWLLDLGGGEAKQLTEVKGRLQSYEWSPDSKRMAMVIGDPDPDDPATAAPGAAAKPPKPIVIDRYRYKQDGQGYLLSNRNSFIYLFDIAGKKLDRLTKGKSDEGSPSWSPDGGRIAFVSNKSDDPDRDSVVQIFTAESKPGSGEKEITPKSNRATRSTPQWSPDGRTIAFLETDELAYGAYSMSHLTLVDSTGATAPTRVMATENLDRGVSSPIFSTDGKAISVLVTDNRSVYPARINLAGGQVERLMSPPIVIASWDQANGRIAVLSGTASKPTEVFALDGGKLTQISHHNDKQFAELNLPVVEEIGFKSKDGTDVYGLLTYPVGYVRGTKVPLLLRIHGGPNAQDQHSFSAERHFFASNGYAVLAVNYRGSAGRGSKFSRAIFADWGNLEVVDLLAGIDHAIQMGVADPDKLGVGGWSYGGILTNYLIATDNRFKAGTSGAGTSFTVGFYGTDQYIHQYDNEIGPPWNPKAWETYQKLSYPFLHADRIKTPTLFLGGERDFNVPIEGSQQMYQALRSLGVDTQLIIYPNENHGIQRPSYVRDRYERYLAWYDKYVKKLPVEPKSALLAWEGKWTGKMVNVPAKPGDPAVEVTMEIGSFPIVNNSCGRWHRTISESGSVKTNNDFKICRGTGAGDIYIDQNGTKVAARIIGDSLIVSFKSGDDLVISTMRLRGEVLEDEVMTLDNKPVVKSMQRIELRRVPE